MEETMQLSKLQQESVQITDNILIYRPNLNALCEIERRTGSITVLDNLTKMKELREVLYVLANKAYFDKDVEEEVISMYDIGKELGFDNLLEVAKKLGQVFAGSDNDVKNSQGSNQEKSSTQETTQAS